MGSKSMSIPKAELHTSQELLQGAEFLADSNDPAMLRAAVLEAFSALETYVQDAVFAKLDRSVHSALAEWLKKTLDDRLDTRLSLLESVAVGNPIDKQLKNDFARAKEIRNNVTHKGRKISAPDARFVIQTIYKLLAYLGSTMELELALVGLKRYVQEQQISVKTDEEAVSALRGYFGRSKAAYSYTELPKITAKKNGPKLKCDLILEFGEYRILVETRLVQGNETRCIFGSRMKSWEYWKDGHEHFYAMGVKPVFMDLVDDMHRALQELELRQGVIVFFVSGQSDTQSCPKQRRGRYTIGFLDDEDKNIKALEAVEKYHNDEVYAVAINLF